jgi:hypothetical protein
LIMVFRVILFQPSIKYKQNNFIGNIIVEVAYAVKKISTLWNIMN